MNPVERVMLSLCWGRYKTMEAAQASALTYRKPRYGLLEQIVVPDICAAGSRHMSSTTLCFGSLSPPSIKRRQLSPNTWTCVGALAIPLWATWPSLAIQTLDIPPFESLAIMFCFGWLVFNQLHRPDSRCQHDRSKIVGAPSRSTQDLRRAQPRFATIRDSIRSGWAKAMRKPTGPP